MPHPAGPPGHRSARSGTCSRRTNRKTSGRSRMFRMVSSDLCRAAYAVTVFFSEGAIAFAMRRESGATISIWMGIAIVKL